MLHYTYTPSGQKITQQLIDEDGRVSTRRDYAGSFVYVNNELAWVNTPHGRMVNKNHGGKEMEEYVLEFHLRDHLGNTRATMQGGALTSQTNYYPFGLTFYSGGRSGTSTLTQNRYLYNGKEYQDDFGLDWYDYGARFYDAQIGRWHVVDNKAEKYYSISTYAYAVNNPIVFIDPDGNEVIYFNSDEGKYQTLNPSSASQPKDSFGKALYQAYMHYSKTGGGENFMKALFSSDIDVIVAQISGSSHFDPLIDIVYWNPERGLKTDQDIVLSPATILEHEAAHQVNKQEDFEGYVADRDPSTGNENYPNREEQNVVEGPEQRTAEAAGEVGKGQPTRKQYTNTSTFPVITTGVTSNKIDIQKTLDYLRKRQQENYWNVEP